MHKIITITLLSLIIPISGLQLDFNPLPKYNKENIHLTTENTVGLREVVTDESVSNVIKNFNSLIDEHKHINEFYLVLDTHGGSVVAGNKLIDYLEFIKSMDKTVHCISQTSISMGFVILQLCPGIRYTTSSAILMQHQMSTMLAGNILNIAKDYEFSKRLYEKMLIKQSDRIKISTKDFFEKTRDDWWIDGEDSIKYNIADKLVNIGCSQELIKKKITVKERHLFGFTSKKVSACPIVNV